MSPERTPPRTPPAADERDWRTVKPFVIGIVSFGLLALFNESRDFDLWRNYAVMGMVLGSPVTWIVYKLDVRVPYYIQWVIVAGLWLHYGGGSVGSPGPHGEPGLSGMHGINGTYHVFSWWDNLTHFMGMAASALAAAYLLDVFQLRRRLGWPRALVGTIAFLSGLAVGAGVELYEYLGKTLFQTIDQGGYHNTMADLAWNFVGATVGSIVGVAVNRGPRWQTMQEQWGRARPQAPRNHLIPPAMIGFLAFVTPPAVTSLVLAGHFLAVMPAESMAAYDGALNDLTLGAAVGIMAGPFAGTLARELRRRRAQRLSDQAKGERA